MEFMTKKENNKGVAMIVCITVIAILIIFCFSLLLVSYTLYASQNKNLQSNRNAEAAKTLSTALTEELKAGEDDSFLCNYLRYNIVAKDAGDGKYAFTWPYYEIDAEGNEIDGHDKANAMRYFELTKTEGVGVEGFPSKVELCMYWMKPESEKQQERFPADMNKLRLFLEITCLSGSQSYVIKNEYRLEVTPRIEPPEKDYSEEIEINPGRNKIDYYARWKWNLVSSE